MEESSHLVGGPGRECARRIGRQPAGHHHVPSLGVVEFKPLGSCHRHVGGERQGNLEPNAAFELCFPC